MKKIVYLLITALVVTSCASNDVSTNYPIQKRKYMDGYHVSFIGKSDETKPANNEKTTHVDVQKMDMNILPHEEHANVKMPELPSNDYPLLASNDLGAVNEVPPLQLKSSKKEALPEINPVFGNGTVLWESIPFENIDQKNNKPNDGGDGDKEGSGKSQLVALLLVLLVGTLGIHRFYLGHIGIGIVQLLTMGGCGIWTLVDLILIITGNLKPKNGEYSEKL